jgi:hypothetical protein
MCNLLRRKVTGSRWKPYSRLIPKIVSDFNQNKNETTNFKSFMQIRLRFWSSGMAKPVGALDQLQIANVPTKGSARTNRAPIKASVKNRTHLSQFTEHLTRLHTYNAHSKRSMGDLWFSHRYGWGLKFGSRPSNATEHSFSWDTNSIPFFWGGDHFMDLEVPLPCSQQPATCPYPEPHTFSSTPVIPFPVDTF